MPWGVSEAWGRTLHVWPIHGREHVLADLQGDLLHDEDPGPHPCWCSPTVEGPHPVTGKVLVTHHEAGN